MDWLRFFRRSKPRPVLNTKETYNFLVVAALQEELDEFYKTNQKHFRNKEEREGGAYLVSYMNNKERVRILTFTPNIMGMPMAAASIMNIISLHNPTYTILIGTCACLNDKYKLGDVIVPARVFSYESGKYNAGIFMPDYAAHSTGDDLRKEAQHLVSKSGNLGYTVITDEDLCSGSAVINDKNVVAEIVQRCGRKLAGVDMEAYSVACINTVLKGRKELTVVKSFSDYAQNKDETEKSGNKTLAKKNSALFAYKLIKHLQESKFTGKNQVVV